MGQNKPVRTDSPELMYTRSRSRSRSPVSHFSSRPCPSQWTYQKQLDDRQTKELLHHQGATNSRRIYSSADPNGTGTDPGGTGGQTGNCPVTTDRSTTRLQQTFKEKPPAVGIQMRLAAPPSKEPQRLMKPIANAFRQVDDSDDSEPEEMPAECRMRMRNIGRDTPTSSGPNSFGKTKHGFCDSKKIFEKKIGGGLSDH